MISWSRWSPCGARWEVPLRASAADPSPNPAAENARATRRHDGPRVALVGRDAEQFLRPSAQELGLDREPMARGKRVRLDTSCALPRELAQRGEQMSVR